MKRSGHIVGSMLLLFLLAGTAGAAPTPVANTKHNLSTSGPGPIRAAATGGTSQICVFCHTPHTAADIQNAPLWNKDIFKNPDPAYSVYTSDVLTQLSYPPAEAPIQTGKAIHIGKTRLCLSCHDGTIALGSLKNLPTGVISDIVMEGGVTTMPTAAAGYIGIELQDDHPVAIPHTTDDPELIVPPTGSVTVFNDGLGTNYVECASCHDPHDNQYGKFLVETNQFSAMCRNCHNKTGFTSSVHDDTTINAPYAPPTGGTPASLGTRVGEVKCMNCHFPHKAGVTLAFPTAPNPSSGKYLLSFQEEDSCFNTTNRWGIAVSVCHGAGGTSAAKDIDVQSELAKFYAHKAGSYSNLHAATEGNTGYGWIGANWHVECADCHNAHTAGQDRHAAGFNTVSTTSTLYGTGGVSLSWPGAWTVPGPINYTYIEPRGLVTATSPGVTFEYQICMKCHSSFAWGGGSPPTSPSLGGNMTDQALEFNPANASYHPVTGSNVNTEGTYVAPWTSGAQTMYCSDCHGNNEAAPAGPHGSTNRSILTAGYDPSNVGTLSSELCFICHNYSTYYSGGVAITNTGFRDGTRNLHYEHMNPVGFVYQGGVPKRCTGCHANPPHGSNKSHLISYGTDPAPYGSYSSLTNYTDPGAGNYNATGSDCTASTCHSVAH